MYLHVENNKQVQYHWPTFVPDVKTYAYEIPMTRDLPVCSLQVLVCLSCLCPPPRKLFNQFTNFHEIQHKRYTTYGYPNPVMFEMPTMTMYEMSTAQSFKVTTTLATLMHKILGPGRPSD